MTHSHESMRSLMLFGPSNINSISGFNEFATSKLVALISFRTLSVVIVIVLGAS